MDCCLCTEINCKLCWAHWKNEQCNYSIKNGFDVTSFYAKYQTKYFINLILIWVFKETPIIFSLDRNIYSIKQHIYKTFSGICHTDSYSYNPPYRFKIWCCQRISIRPKENAELEIRTVNARGFKRSQMNITS